MITVHEQFVRTPVHARMEIKASDGRAFFLVQHEEGRNWMLCLYPGQALRRLSVYDLGTVMWLFPDGVMYAHDDEHLVVSGVIVPPDVLVKAARYVRPGHTYRIAGATQYQLMALGKLFDDYRVLRSGGWYNSSINTMISVGRRAAEDGVDPTLVAMRVADDALRAEGFNTEELELIYSLGQTGVTHPASVMEAIEAFRGIDRN